MAQDGGRPRGTAADSRRPRWFRLCFAASDEAHAGRFLPAPASSLGYAGPVLRGRLTLLALATMVSLASAVPRSAEADTIEADPKLGYVPVEELSYETIIRTGSGDEAELVLRVALHNASAATQDTVGALVLPRGAELVGLAINDGGDWIEGAASKVVAAGADDKDDFDQGRRDPGTIWARPLEPETPGDLPAVELVAYGLPAQATVQVELRLRIRPVLRGDRWQVELPRRNAKAPTLVDQRRVLVQGLGEGQSFWVDEVSSAGSPYMVTRAEDAVLVSWQARGGASLAQLDGSLETSPDADGGGGRLRMVLRLGASKPVAPDHVILVVDRSRSGSSTLARDSERMFAGLLDRLPKGTTFDAITFAREAEGLLDPARLGAGKAPRVDSRDAREELTTALGATVPGQGTDLRRAMTVAGEHLAARQAKQPLVLIVTDGMLPPSIGADAVGKALGDALGKAARPEILFVVDDPLLNARGLPADHPVSNLAAGLGARLSLETLANLGSTQIDELLTADRKSVV